MNETNDYSQLVIDLIACYNGNCRPCSRNENPGDGGCVRIMKEAATAISDLETRLTQRRIQFEPWKGQDEIVFTKRLAELIEKAGISQREIAIRIGVTEVTMARIASGRRMPGAVILWNLANVLHTSVDYLLGIEQEKTERGPDHAAADEGGGLRDPEDLHPDAGATPP